MVHFAINFGAGFKRNVRGAQVTHHSSGGRDDDRLCGCDISDHVAMNLNVLCANVRLTRGIGDDRDRTSRMDRTVAAALDPHI